MALRNKFKSLLKLDTVKPLQGSSDISSVAPTNVYFEQKPQEFREFDDDPTPDDDVIACIEPIYFNDQDFDPNQHELERLSESLIIDDIDLYRNTLRRQLQAVSRQFSQKILEKQGAYVRELERVIDLQSSLQKATSVCARGRRCLETAKQEASLGSLNVLAKHRRKVLLLDLLKSLRIIKTLQQTDVRLQELLEEDDYPRAIQLCLECQQAASTYRHFTCISELNSKLQETLDGIEEQLDVALSKLCNKFNASRYDSIHSAYELLGKTQTAMDQLQMHYVNTVNTVALHVVSEHLKDPSFLSQHDQDLSFTSLCKNVDPDKFLPCLIALCKNFWEVMHSYQQTFKWHEFRAESRCAAVNNEDNNLNVKQETHDSDRMGSPNSNISAMFDQQYIKNKLEQGLTRIWQDIQQKIRCHILSTDLAYFKYDDFINVLDVINRVIQIGEDFCGSRSQSLQESVRVQTINYFTAYHRATLDELRMFLENEMWELCPVQAKFNILGMPEFQFLRPQALAKKGHRKTASGTVKPEQGYFSKFTFQNSPFDTRSDDHTDLKSDGLQTETSTSKTNGLYHGNNDDDDEDDDDDDELDELKMDFVDERTGEELKERTMAEGTKRTPRFSSKTPIVTNTTLNVLRSFGKYIHMMTVLKPISFDVVICMSQLFDYYLYSVYTFFGSADGPTADWNLSLSSSLSNRMQTTLKRISNNIILKSMDNINHEELKIPAPTLSPMVNLKSEEQLFGLSNRVIAMESLVFLAKQLKLLQNHLDSYIPSQKRAFLSQFYSQTVDVTEELRVPVYRCVAEKAVDYAQTIQLMSNVKWDIREIMSQHSAYVDVLLLEFQSFSLRMASISKVVPIPKDACHVLWSHVIQISNRSFVEGFANVRRCSNEGRALMQLDYQQYLMKLEKFNPVKPIPGRDFVETFVKAFYLNEPDLESWIKEHTEYSTKQLHSLITCGVGSHISKKGKQKLLAALEDLDKSRSK